LLASLVTAGACATSAPIPPATQPAEAGPTRYKVTVVSAGIEEKDPDQKPWHEQEPTRLMSTVAILAASWSPVAAGIVSLVASPEKGSELRPSPYVEVLFDGEKLRSGIRLMTVSPTWKWSFAVEANDHLFDGPITFWVRDGYDEDGKGERLLGKYETKVQALVTSRQLQVPAPDSVQVLQLQVEPLRDPFPKSEVSFRVPADKSLIELVNRQGSQPEGGWRPIPVLNGDAIRITAKGSVRYSCLYGGGKEAGPDGEAEITRGCPVKPLELCGNIPHHSLVAFLAGKPIRIG
jgi:hypothetical protein